MISPAAHRGDSGLCFPRITHAFLRRLLLLAVAAITVISCRQATPADDVAALEPLLIAPSIGQPKRSTRDDRGRRGDPVHVIELEFESDQSIADLRRYFNRLLLDQSGYVQAVNISTPGAAQTEYSSSDGSIYIVLTLEQQQPSLDGKQPTEGVLEVHLVVSYLKEPS